MDWVAFVSSIVRSLDKQYWVNTYAFEIFLNLKISPTESISVRYNLFMLHLIFCGLWIYSRYIIYLVITQEKQFFALPRSQVDCKNQSVALDSNRYRWPLSEHLVYASRTLATQILLPISDRMFETDWNQYIGRINEQRHTQRSSTRGSQ